MTSRRDEIIRLRKEDLTYAEIGRRFGITKERVRQILTPKLRKPALEKPTLRLKVMLTAGDVASLLGIHVNTVRRWADKGILRPYRFGTRGDRRFRREDIDAFLEKGKAADPPNK
jgi:excisionase family DNA binding protein